MHGLHEGVALEHHTRDQGFRAIRLGSLSSRRHLEDGIAFGVHELLDQSVLTTAEEDRRRVRHCLDTGAAQHFQCRIQSIVAHLVRRLAGDTLEDVVTGLEHLSHLVVHVGAENEHLAAQTLGLDSVGVRHSAAFIRRPQHVDLGVRRQHGL